MKPRLSLKKPLLREADDPAPEQLLPLDDAPADKNTPSGPELETALDDEEGGADPIDPDTGKPYDDSDPGEAGLPAGRTGGTPEI